MRLKSVEFMIMETVHDEVRYKACEYGFFVGMLLANGLAKKHQPPKRTMLVWI